MRTLILEPATAGLDGILERRRRSGLDRLDEVWEGVLHMVPAPAGRHSYVAQQLAEVLGPPARQAGLVPGMGEFNLGESDDDYRVPDGGVHRAIPDGLWLPTAAIIIEIVSPGDESWEKLPFYADHRVDEVIIVDPLARTVQWLGLDGGEYKSIDRSRLIDLGPAELAAGIHWPGTRQSDSAI